MEYVRQNVDSRDVLASATNQSSVTLGDLCIGMSGRCLTQNNPKTYMQAYIQPVFSKIKQKQSLFLRIFFNVYYRVPLGVISLVLPLAPSQGYCCLSTALEQCKFDPFSG